MLIFQFTKEKMFWIDNNLTCNRPGLNQLTFPIVYALETTLSSKHAVPRITHQSFPNPTFPLLPLLLMNVLFLATSDNQSLSPLWSQLLVLSEFGETYMKIVSALFMFNCKEIMIRALSSFHALFKNHVSVEKYLHLKFILSDECSTSSNRCNTEAKFPEQSSRKYKILILEKRLLTRAEVNKALYFYWSDDIEKSSILQDRNCNSIRDIISRKM